MTLRVAIMGLGKIARDQHVPAIAATDGIELAAIVSRSGGLPGLPYFQNLPALLDGAPDIDAIALCTPPQGREVLAALALQAGKHVLMEKPPAATVAGVLGLGAEAAGSGRTLFATWHSRHAPAVEPAREILAQCAIRSVHIEWAEDVRVWHPGQAWIWQPGGFGVFDPGINALSILTRILPRPVALTEAELEFPSNRDAPIAARLRFAGEGAPPVTARFDWRQTGPQTWDIRAETDRGTLVLSEGGAKLHLDGRSLVDAAPAEYPALYRRFVALVAAGESDVDPAPLVHVADAFMLGRRRVVEPFLEADEPTNT